MTCIGIPATFIGWPVIYHRNSCFVGIPRIFPDMFIGIPVMCMGIPGMLIGWPAKFYRNSCLL